MCCIQISNDILFENVLGSIKIKEGNIERISFEDIENCGIFLENNLPGYIDCEVNIQSLHEIAKSYGFTIEDNAIINLSAAEVTKRKSARLYPANIAAQIEGLVNIFLEQKTIGQDVARMKHVVVR